MIMVPESVIQAQDVALFLQARPATGAAGAPTGNPLAAQSFDSLKDARNAFEKEYIARKLREHQWNISKTADDLQIERSHLHRKIKLLGVEMRPEH